MDEEVLSRLHTLLDNWQQMKGSDEEDAGEDADRFQMSFYAFTEALREALRGLSNPPIDVEEARRHPDFARLFEVMPEPLQVPFEMELDDILSGVTRDVDSTEQS